MKDHEAGLYGMSDDELDHLHTTLLERHRADTDQILLIEDILATRHAEAPVPTGEQNYERALGRACLDGEITASEAVLALDHFLAPVN